MERHPGYSRTVIFDGECGFCRRWIDRGRRLDKRGRIEWLARLAPGVKERFPQLDEKETKERMVSIRPDGKAYGGFFAFRDIALHLPASFLPALLLYIPGISLVGEPIYKWVARNRHLFGKKPADSCSRS